MVYHSDGPPPQRKHTNSFGVCHEDGLPKVSTPTRAPRALGALGALGALAPGAGHGDLAPRSPGPRGMRRVPMGQRTLKPSPSKELPVPRPQKTSFGKHKKRLLASFCGRGWRGEVWIPIGLPWFCWTLNRCQTGATHEMAT